MKHCLAFTIILLVTVVQSFRVSQEMPSQRSTQSHLSVSSAFFLELEANENFQLVATLPLRKKLAKYNRRQANQSPEESQSIHALECKEKPHIETVLPDDTSNNKCTTTTAANNNKVRTLYEILGASPHDSRAALKKRYLFLAKKLHPDAVQDGDPNSTSGEFSQISAAWTVLSDPKQRLRYDRRLQAEVITEQICCWADQFVNAACQAIETTWSLLEDLANAQKQRATKAF